MQSDLTACPSTPVSTPRLDPNAVLGCQFGHYPWDDWHRWVLAQGLDEDLAGSGRLLIREAFNHDWPGWLKAACGWSDNGQALLALALCSPRKARRQWDILMRTDGLRGDYPSSSDYGVTSPRSSRLRRAGRPRSVEWVWGYLRSDARRLLVILNP